MPNNSNEKEKKQPENKISKKTYKLWKQAHMSSLPLWGSETI
jgi:hypothetical protein